MREAYVLGVLNSIPFDWQARRFVEMSLNFFILNLLCFPSEEAGANEIAWRAARLSSPDPRFADFATATGVSYGPLSSGERQTLRAEIDALVAHAYRLSAEDLAFMFTDFPSTEEGLSADYRALVLGRFEALA